MHYKTLTFDDGRKLAIHQDDSPESPRDWYNNGIMVCWHSRYNLGDKHDHQTPQDFQEWMREQGDDIIACLPLYLYDHSGITMSTRPFTCPWDSGQVGWIIATRESLESGGHKVDELDVKQVEEWLRGEVETYDQYLRNDVWGFVVTDEDSCWGFYGDDPKDNGMIDHLDETMAQAIENGAFEEEVHV